MTQRIWNYRMVKTTGQEGEGIYLYEVYYNSKKEIWGIAPATPFGETLEEFIGDLENMLADAKNQSVIELDKLVFAKMYD